MVIKKSHVIAATSHQTAVISMQKPFVMLSPFTITIMNEYLFNIHIYGNNHFNGDDNLV